MEGNILDPELLPVAGKAQHDTSARLRAVKGRLETLPINLYDLLHVSKIFLETLGDYILNIIRDLSVGIAISTSSRPITSQMKKLLVCLLRRSRRG